MIIRPEHRPLGDPCVLCGREPLKHRVDHKPLGDPCARCGLPALNHRPARSPEYVQRKNRKSTLRWRMSDKADDAIYLGIDGEGQGRQFHKYVMLAASDEAGERSWVIENSEGLSTVDCLEFILSLPVQRTKVFSYSFQYDLTKMLADIDNARLWYLFRPEKRPQRFVHKKKKNNGPRAIYWNGYKLNLQGTKFTIDRGGRSVTLWDVFKFFQGKFVSALKDWKVGTKEIWDRMTLMKDKRSEFDKESIESVRTYCLEECKCMAMLAHKLTKAHEDCPGGGLVLRSYYGAGSSASAMLSNMGIKEKIVLHPSEMNLAVASGFFGGRFENSVIGSIREGVFNFDISSAYPYQLCFLPCLMHGHWIHTRNRRDLDHCATAIVRYTLERPNCSNKRTFFGTGGQNVVESNLLSRHSARGTAAWGPFPFRTDEGSICFPIESGGGWVWRDEFLAGERLFDHVGFEEAWVYKQDCDCKPFESIPQYYTERLRIGKEGPGIVLKLGTNSCYGKLAQSIGNAIFNSWIWAGIITSGTRAQILDLLGLHDDWANLLMVATDGIYTREDIKPPAPKDTGTWNAVNERGEPVQKPLGGWERKPVPNGVFVARPGIYFPTNPTAEDLKEVRGRGVGKGVVLANHQKIVESWEEIVRRGYALDDDRAIAKIANVDRFCGAKTSITKTGKQFKRAWSPGPRRMSCSKCRRELANNEIACPDHANAEVQSPPPSYGEWITRSVTMGFNPLPKRDRLNPDGLTLALRSLPGQVSLPYDRVTKSAERRELEAAYTELLEQPDADLSDYDWLESEDVGT